MCINCESPEDDLECEETLEQFNKWTSYEILGLVQINELFKKNELLDKKGVVYH